MDSISFIIFAVGFLVSMTVVYGIFSQVPLEINPDEKVNIRASSVKTSTKN